MEELFVMVDGKMVPYRRPDSELRALQFLEDFTPACSEIGQDGPQQERYYRGFNLFQHGITPPASESTPLLPQSLPH